MNNQPQYKQPQQTFADPQQQQSLQNQHQQFYPPQQQHQAQSQNFYGNNYSQINNASKQTLNQPNYNQDLSFLQQTATQLLINPNTWQSVGNQIQTQIEQQTGSSNWFSFQAYKSYWNVDNFYVLNKLLLILFPFRHQHWDRTAVIDEQSGNFMSFKPPRYDINSPDLYIPVMSFVTYSLLIATSFGFKDKFTPEVLTMAASSCLFILAVEVLFLRLGIYLLNINMNEYRLSLTDLFCYSSYQFVPVIIIQLSSTLTGSRVSIVSIFLAIYIVISFGWFTLRSLRRLILTPSNIATPGSDLRNISGITRKSRVYFLFCFVCLQGLCLWWLIY